MASQHSAPFQAQAPSLVASGPSVAPTLGRGASSPRLSRRNLFKLAGGVAAGFAIAGGHAFAEPFVGRAEAAGLPYVAYHGATSAEHQARFDGPGSLPQQGYRPISLSVYRTPDGVRYAAIWSLQSGPSWYAYHGMTPSAYQSRFDEMTAQGYRPIIITGTGGAMLNDSQVSDPTYAAMFVKDSTPFVARHGADYKAFKTANNWAQDNGFVLRSASILLGQEQRQYAGIWEQAPAGLTWDYEITKSFDGPEAGVPTTKAGGLGLSYVTRSPFADYLAIYRSDQEGDRVERHAMTAAQYQAQYDALHTQGYAPVSVQAGGDPRASDTPRFVAIFERF